MLVQLGGVDQVLLQVGVEPEHPLGDGGRPQPGDELERPAAALTTRLASRYRVAPVIMVGSASKPSRSPCSATSRAAKAS